MGAIYKKELRSYATGMIGAIYVGIFLLISGFVIAVENFMNASASFEDALQGFAFVFVLTIPILTMRAIAEEKNAKTDQLLYSLPISLSKIVMAKYFAIITVLAVPFILLGLIPLAMSMYGTVHLPTAYSALFAMYLLGCALSAVGMFFSSLTEIQVISAVISFVTFFICLYENVLEAIIPSGALASAILFGALALVIALILYFMTRNALVSVIIGVILVAGDAILYLVKKSLFEGAFAKVLSVIAVFDRLENSFNGFFDLSAIVYYLSIIALFVFFTIQSMEKKRWSEVG